MSPASRVTSVGPMNWGNSMIASFSGWSRKARGLLNTLAPSRSACSSRWVAQKYSLSKGGSLRMSTASKSASQALRCAGASYQWVGSPVRRMSCTRALTLLLRFAHHRERGVLVDLEAVQRVGNEEQFHGVRSEGCATQVSPACERLYC